MNHHHGCGCSRFDTVTGLLHRPPVVPRRSWLVLTDLCGLRNAPPSSIEGTLAAAALAIPGCLSSLYDATPVEGYRWGGDEYLWTFDEPRPPLRLQHKVRQYESQAGITFWHVCAPVPVGFSVETIANGLVHEMWRVKRAQRGA